MNDGSNGVVTLTPQVLLGGILRADADAPGLREVASEIQASARFSGACGDCSAAAFLADVYVKAVKIVLSCSGDGLAAWKRVFRASSFRVILAGKGEVML